MKVLKREDFRIVCNNKRPPQFCVEQKHRFLFWTRWSRHQVYYGTEPCGVHWFSGSWLAEDHINESIANSNYKEKVWINTGTDSTTE